MSSDGQVQAHEEDAEATLGTIDAVILFPALGAPCVVEQSDTTYLEVIIAFEKNAHVSPGSLAHYLQFRPFQDPYPATDNAAESACDETRAENVFVTQDAWSMADFKNGVSAEKPSHVGTQGSITLDHPIFNLTTCRLHEFVVDKLKDDYPDVYRVLFKASALPVGQMMELHWLSKNHHDGFLTKLKDNAKNARGTHLDDKESFYGAIHMRHPFMVVASADSLPKKFCHLTDIHNSSAHNLMQLASCSVLEGQGDKYSWPVGTRFNNYNRNFSYLADVADADALVLTGDIVDYGRGLYYGADHNLASPPNGLSADDLQALMLSAGRSTDPIPVIAQARSKLPPKTIWDEMGGSDDQRQYAYDGNMHYFILEKILPRYVGAKPRPVYTSLGNHDFHPNPFPPWPTTSGSEDEDSKNPFTPSDYNLTRYEAILAYGPLAYTPYLVSTLETMMTPFSGGGSGLLSIPEACMIYFFFVNPWLDYSVRFGPRSIMMVDFGREEVRPQGAIGSAMPAVLGAVLAVGGAALAIYGAYKVADDAKHHRPVNGWSVAAIVGGALLATAGALMLAGAVRDGFFAGSFEELDDLPAANNALTDEQYALIDKWSQLDGIDSRAMFCHALILGRAQKLISIQQFNSDGFGGNTFDKMKYGVLSKKRDEIIQKLQSGAITVTMSGHSHYRSNYVLAESGNTCTAEMPGLNLTPRNRLCVVSPASGPMAEVNVAQDDVAADGGGKSKYIDRQLRAEPGGTVLTLDGGNAVVQPLSVGLDQSKTPRRAAFDSWKNRVDRFYTPNWRRDDQNWHPSVEDEEVRVQLSYVSDLAPGREMQMTNGQVTTPQGPVRWPLQLAAVTFFPADGPPLTLPLTFELATAEASIALAQKRDGYTAHQYVLVMSRDQFRMVRMLAGTKSRMTCAVEYGTDDDPWIFDITVASSSAVAGATMYDLNRNEFPEFDKRQSDLHYDQPLAAAPSGAAASPPSGNS